MPNGLLANAKRGSIQPYSGATEIASVPIQQHDLTDADGAVAAVSVSPELVKAMEVCRIRRDEQLLLPSWRSRFASFVAPFRLFLAMEAGGQRAVEHVLADAFFPPRKRKPNLEKAALIAITYFARPEATGEKSLCSDYACVLETAHDQGIKPEQIVTWLASTTLGDCKKATRAKRAAKSKRTAAVHGDVGQPRAQSDAKMPSAPEGRVAEDSGYKLRVAVRTHNSVPKYVIAYGPSQNRVGVVARVSNADSLPTLLRRLADAYEKSPWNYREGQDD
ncbi:hypothetical protein [Mesorhizobium sp. M7A.F.Ce.TU.012.03.2.1]|uniref:hypothetical protein n=1 Tax=Mesorhizobium sp. M7A.F.Ce.TU.012.03.2.1 TaxID=2493681 RepID=UPI000FD6CC32|nr:hypothetical protein [Mesorhizobium sp. M7A.F.Ce.TU.012.03.2.1]AZV18152.1 hypothetical protein EJ079_03110 [Mesorhizobium sp. M7A.F.Ce.TU.012.03.2.1]